MYGENKATVKVDKQAFSRALLNEMTRALSEEASFEIRDHVFGYRGLLKDSSWRRLHEALEITAAHCAGVAIELWPEETKDEN